jgi:hypothetical protein
MINSLALAYMGTRTAAEPVQKTILDEAVEPKPKPAPAADTSAPARPAAAPASAPPPVPPAGSAPAPK